MYIRKLLLIFLGLFVMMVLGGIVLAYLNNMPIVMEEQLAEGFYYAAIGFAVYHIFTRNKQLRETKAKEAEAAAKREAEKNATAQIESDGGTDEEDAESDEYDESGDPGESDPETVETAKNP